MVVSVPEKTLEHWASIYITYRFRSHAGLWWPVDGEDIAVEHLPPKPGKALLLEMKTARVKKSRPGQHSVIIDNAQLAAYLSLPFALQPYYVFPKPDWQGELSTAARAEGIDQTEVGFRRNSKVSPIGWAADWLWVLHASEVSALVSTAAKPTLVTYSVKSDGSVDEAWAGGASRPTALKPWRDFWDFMVSCGSERGAAIALPVGGGGDTSHYGRPAILAAINAAKNSSQPVHEVNYYGWTGERYSIDFAAGYDWVAEISENLIGVHLGLESLNP